MHGPYILGNVTHTAKKKSIASPDGLRGGRDCSAPSQMAGNSMQLNKNPWAKFIFPANSSLS